MLFLVAKKCQQEGLNPSKMEIGQSIQHVNAFFKRGKVSGIISILRIHKISFFQRIGDKDCRVASTAKVFSSNPREKVPQFFQKIIEFEKDSSDDSALIVELSQVGGKFQEFKKEPTLVLKAVDLNNKDFSLVLAQILVKEKSIIYIDTQFLTEKGVKRLSALLKDVKELFDDRLWVILFSQNESSGRFSTYVEKVFEFDATNKGKTSLAEEEMSGEGKKRLKSSDDLEKLKKQISDLSELIDNEKLLHAETKSLFSEEAKALDQNIKNQEEINLTLESDIKDMKTVMCGDQERLRLSLLREKKLQMEKDELCREVQKVNETRKKAGQNEEELRLRLIKSEEEILRLSTERQDMLAERDQHEAVNAWKVKLLEIETEKDRLSEKVRMMEEERIRPSSTHSASQTKTVNIFDSPITHIVKNIKTNQKKNPKAEAKEIIHRSIQNLKYSVALTQIGPQVKCVVLIEKGKEIMKYKDMLSGEAIASNKSSAEKEAFAILLERIIKFENDN